MLTIAKLSRWSINYYNDTAKAVGQAAKDAGKAGGGLGEYYTEHDTRTPVWLCAGDTHTAAQLVGLTDIQRAGGEADTEVVERWLDDGVAPSGECGRALGTRGVQAGFEVVTVGKRHLVDHVEQLVDLMENIGLRDCLACAEFVVDGLSAHAGQRGDVRNRCRRPTVAPHQIVDRVENALAQQSSQLGRIGRAGHRVTPSSSPAL